MSKFITSTIGLHASHKNLSCCKLMRVELYRVGNGVELQAVSGHNLSRIKTIKTVLISEDDWQESPYDPYDNSVMATWALGMIGAKI